MEHKSSFLFPIRRHALLLGALLAWSPPLPVACADEASEAKTRVDAAATDVEKINALYNYARALNRLNATREEQLQAREAMEQSLALIARLEKTGKVLKPQSQFHYYAGLLAAQLDDYAGAALYFDAAERQGFVQENIALGGKGALLFERRGEAKWKNYDYTGALADFNRAIELENKPGDYAQRARLHFDRGDADAARSDWAKGNKIPTGEQRDFRQIAGARARMDGLSTQAIDEFPFDPALLPFNKAIAQSPRATPPLLERATYLIRRGVGVSGGAREEIAKAQRDINHVLRLEPASSAAFHLRALALWRLATLDNKLLDAESEKGIATAFNQALRNASNRAAIRLDIGDYLLARAQHTQPQPLAPAERDKVLGNAVFNYSEVIRLEPQNTLARAKRIRAEQLHERSDVHLVLTDSALIAQSGLTASSTADAAAIEDLQKEVEVARVQALLQSGAWTDAEKSLQSALQKDPHHPTLLQLSGQLHTLRGRYDEAIKALQESLNYRRANAQSWWWLGLALDGKGDTAHAKQSLANAVKIDARLAPLTVGTRYAADNPTNKPIVMPPIAGDIKPQGTAMQHKEAGNALREKNDTAGALAEYSLALQIDPNFADALNNRASIYQQQGKLDLALSNINRALELEPKHRVASLVRADIRFALGELEAALDDLNNAVRYADTDERRVSALLSRARVRGRTKDKAGALQDLSEAEKLATGNAERLKQIAELRATLEK